VFDLAGVYPLRMRVAGVLAPAHSPDDEAVFVDVKTAWVIEGLGHGHGDLSAPAADAGVLSREGSRITANASVVEYTEITPENLDSFHFHGQSEGYPVTGVIAVPRDARSGVLLLGRYQSSDAQVQLARPATVMSDLLATVFTVRRYVVAAIAGVAAATLATATLVFGLSLRLRRREIATLVKIGGSRASVATVLAAEVVVVLLASSLLAGGLTLAVRQLGASAIRALLVT
jgi:putative ABC transport system permease protein